MSIKNKPIHNYLVKFLKFFFVKGLANTSAITDKITILFRYKKYLKQ